MKPILSCGLVLCLLLVLVACGGSSSTPAPPPNPNNAGFSNASLNGSYVYRVSGVTANSSFSAVGVFVTDGNGHITSGQQDTNDTVLGFNSSSGGATPALTGTYTVGVDGRGQAVLNYSTGSSITFDFVLSNVIPGSVTPGITPTGRIIAFSSAQIASGRLEKQSAPAAISGTYVVRFDGFVPNSGGTALLPIGRVGVLTLNGATVSAATLDENLLNGTSATFTANIVPSTATATALDAAGRGTMHLALPAGGVSGTGGTTDLIFYFANANRLEFITRDATSSIIGSADLQPSSSITPTGNYVFGVAGSSSVFFVPFSSAAEVGSFTLSGTTLSNGLEDSTDSGVVLRQSTSFSGVLDSAVSNGRATGNFTAGSRTVHFVLWFNDVNHAVMMTSDSDLLETGLVQNQPAPPTNSTVTGNYALRLAGATFGGSLTLTGQVQSNGQGTLTGLEDFNLSGGLSTPTGATASGSYGFAASGRGTGSIGGTPVVLYPADANTIFMLSTDGNIIQGSLEAQH